MAQFIGAWMSNYFLKTSQFEGPMDLLLHLVRVHEIDIFDIDIFKLTKQYLDYLRMMKFEDLAQASDFIQMAATLIEIKTRMLLPNDEKRVSENDEDEDEDPIRTLQERLFQYETFRNVADHFNQMPQMGIEIQTNNEWYRLDPIYEHVEAPLTGEAATLIVLYEQMLTQLSERRNSTVTAITHKVTVEEIINRLEQEILQARFALFQGYYNKFQSRYELVVHILAMLQLSKDKRMRVFQDEMFGPVWMYRMDCDEKELPHSSHLSAEEIAHAIVDSATEAPAEGSGELNDR